MAKFGLFCEDDGHRSVVSALIRRVCAEYGLRDEIIPYNSTGGFGSALESLKRYVSDLRRERERLFDCIVVAIDANCSGYNEKQKEIREIVADLRGFTVMAIPDPHVERWLLLDGSAFRQAVGVGCQAPDEKCQKNRYKSILRNSFEDAEIFPVFHGIEWAEDIVANMDLRPGRNMDRSLGNFLDDLRSWASGYGN